MAIENGFRVDTKWDNVQIEQSVKSISYGIEKEISKNLVNLQDQGIWDALIAMGWTPPSE